MTIKVDKGPHILLGDKRADKQQVGETAWTLLSDNMWVGPPHRITRLERMPR